MSGVLSVEREEGFGDEWGEESPGDGTIFTWDDDRSEIVEWVEAAEGCCAGVVTGAVELGEATNTIPVLGVESVREDGLLLESCP